MIIDTHTHIYPDKIANKATEAIGTFYDIPMQNVGTTETLLKALDEANIEKSFILSTATTPKQVRSINEFVISVKESNPDRFIAFGTVHPDMAEPEHEIDFIRHNGVVGLKFHHDFLKIAVDDKRMDRIYDYASQTRTPIIFHAGDKRYHYTNPAQFLAVTKRFPKLMGIAAHFGGYSEWTEAYDLLCDTNLWFDTSSSFFEINKELAKNIISKHGSEKIFFASDFPMWKPKDELQRFYELGLTDEVNEQILYKNAENFLSDLN
ncbi:MAG: amidohydrolase [Clostridiales bacterium]|nr:MAG: amidohydrolase [Clostridiales bacterium]